MFHSVMGMSAPVFRLACEECGGAPTTLLSCESHGAFFFDDEHLAEAIALERQDGHDFRLFSIQEYSEPCAFPISQHAACSQQPDAPIHNEPGLMRHDYRRQN